jgi:hypothetical protein
MVSHGCNPYICEAEAGGLQIWGQPGLNSKLKASLGNIVKRGLKKNKIILKNLSYLKQL